MLKFYMAFFLALLLGICLSFPILKICKKFHLSQTILHYVDKHAGKSGTPTMGGLIFIFAIIFSSLFFLQGEILNSVLALATMFGYGLLGFLDDFIKIKFHKNEGLRPYQKIVGQVGLALIFAIYSFLNVGGKLEFFGLSFDIGFFIIPFIVFFFVAVTNSVNLIDGLDGLAGGVNSIYFLFFGLILILLGFEQYALICFANVGALLAFLIVNCFPAKIFMGDTGSLALGGLMASIATLSSTELLMPIIGLVFVITVISDILQVLHFKRTHKRIFLMAPLHHHFEKKGVHENRIVLVYILITLVLGLSVLLGYMALAGVI